jgi:signal-transduction protein with cAMP-binding, CBS, and nucleotidyltransferase domain
VLEGTIVEVEQEAVLSRRDGVQTEVMLSVSRKNLGSQKVLVLTARDVSATKRIKEELDESREQYRQLINRLRIGIFRTTPGPRFKILEANQATLKLFGLEHEEELIDSDLFDHLEQDKSAPPLAAGFDQQGIAKELIFRVKNRSAEAETVSVSMIEGRDLEGRVSYCDGLIEDVSSQQKTADERERLIVELQTSLMFMNQPIGSSLGSYVCCEHSTTVRQAAEMMSEKRTNAILVRNGETMVGLISDRLLRERVVAKNLADTTPVEQVMKTPLVYIEDRALIFEAAMLLQEEDIDYLVVRDEHDGVVSVISNEELLDVHRYSANFMIEQIRTSTSVEAIVQSHYRLPRIIKALNDSGAHARNITRIITTISDTVLERLVDMAIEKIGEPPVRFAFISVGSEGRGEQTLVTDQDNAIIFEDVDESTAAQVHDYFHRFATMICTWLDEVGYQFCKGEIMAMTPKWCQPISVWKSYFTGWIGKSTPEDLMEVAIFFDFRCLYGDQRFTSELHEHIRSRAQNQKAFLYQMAQNTLLFKVPLDFFGNLSVESGGEHADTFNIKHVIAQIVGFARIYAIFYGLEITNTLQRINRLLETDVLKPDVHQEIVESYNYLMQLRFRHQIKRIDEGLEPDNHVHIKEISHMEKELLEKILANINQLRKRLSLVGHNEIYF